MKPLYPFLIAFTVSMSANSQVEMGAAYSLALPQQEMASNIQPVHNLNGSFLYHLKGKLSRVAVGGELGIGIYALITREQDLRFPDGSSINTDITYESNLFTGNLQTRISLFENARVNPYLIGKAGYANMFSDINIEDPDDPLGCRPLDRKNLMRDHSFFLAYGAGVQIGLEPNCKKQKPGISFINISVTRIAGGSLDYINTKHIMDHSHADPSTSPPQLPKSTPLNVRFVNASTQIMHEHQVAEVYNSPLRLLDIRVGVHFRFPE